jgi:hypothetical protein
VVPAAAADFPTKPVRMIVPWPAGGATDALGRMIGQRLTEVMGQQIVIDNRGGAAGAIGAGVAARATPDGYTFIILEGSHVIAPATTAQLPYDIERDFAPLTLVGVSPLILFVHAGLPVKSVGDFLAAAKAKPGQIPVAHSSTGSLTHLVAELFQQRTGVKLNLVGYKGAAPAFIALASGEAHLYIVTLASARRRCASGARERSQSRPTSACLRCRKCRRSPRQAYRTWSPASGGAMSRRSRCQAGYRHGCTRISSQRSSTLRCGAPHRARRGRLYQQPQRVESAARG